MSNEEFEATTALEKVRAARATIDQLDFYVGEIIIDSDHAQMRRVLRAWEQKLEASISIRKKRSDAQLPLETAK